MITGYHVLLRKQYCHDYFCDINSTDIFRSIDSIINDFNDSVSSNRLVMNLPYWRQHILERKSHVQCAMYSSGRGYDGRVMTQPWSGDIINAVIFTADLANSHYAKLHLNNNGHYIGSQTHPVGNKGSHSHSQWLPQTFVALKRLAPSNWEVSLQSNGISHWLGAYFELALQSLI